MILLMSISTEKPPQPLWLGLNLPGNKKPGASRNDAPGLYLTNQCADFYAAILRRRRPTTPANALPNNQTAPGTGTGEAVILAT